MGIEGMDGLSLLFTSIASCELGHFDWPQSFPNFCRRTCPQCLWMPLNFLQHVSTLYLGSIWRLWMGIEGMDGLFLLFAAIASRKCPGTRFAGFCPLRRQTRCRYFWMPLNFLQHVFTLYLGPIWRLWMGIEGMDGLLLLFTAIASRKCLGARFACFCPPSRMNALPLLLDAAEYFAACFHIVFGTHME